MKKMIPVEEVYQGDTEWLAYLQSVKSLLQKGKEMEKARLDEVNDFTPLVEYLEKENLLEEVRHKEQRVVVDGGVEPLPPRQRMRGLSVFTNEDVDTIVFSGPSISDLLSIKILYK
jgi:hypothetical protein